MSEDLEVVLPSHRVAKSLKRIAMELDQRVARLAIEMVVARVTVIVLEDAAAAQGFLRNMPASTNSPSVR